MAAEDDDKQELGDAAQRRPFFSRVEIYLPLIFIGGFAIALLFYVQSLTELGWSTKPREESSQVGVINPFATPAALTVVLYVSPSTQQYLAEAGGNYEPLIQQWRSFLKEEKRSFQEVDQPGDLDKIGSAVLVLPTAIALSEIERKAILAHQARGGAILASGPLGARDEKGQWREWRTLQSLFGVLVKSDTPVADHSRYLITGGADPITLGLQAGTRVWLAGTSESVLQFTGGNPAASLGDWARKPTDAGSALVYGSAKGARWVLLGYTENAWDAQPFLHRKIATGALDWLQAQPKAFVGAWPQAHRAAFMVGMDMEQAPENALNLSSMLETVQMAGSFYVQGAAAPSAVLGKLATGRHEIAFHGDGPEGFKSQPLAEQKRRMDVMRQQLLQTFGKVDGIAGFKPPADSADPNTEAAALAHGLTYMVTDANRVEHRLPVLAGLRKDKPGEDLVLLPRTQRDDVGVLTMPDATQGDLIAALKADATAVIQQGGLGMLSLHSQNFAKDSALQQALGAFLFALAERRKEVWLATGKDVAQWWRQREALRANISVVGGRQELRLSYYGAQPVVRPTVIVLHPFKSSLQLNETRAWIPRPTIIPIDEYQSAVVFDEVASGNYAYQAVFQP